MATISEVIVFNRELCCACGIPFFLEEKHQVELRGNEKMFYCPNGHAQHYTQSEAGRLRKELAAAQQREETIRQQRDVAQALRDKAWADLDKERKAKKALAKRVKAGVCPCCHRTVSQMARHMKTKHPGYAP